MKRFFVMSLVAVALVGCGKAPMMVLPEAQAPSYSVDLTVNIAQNTQTSQTSQTSQNTVAKSESQLVLDQLASLAKVGPVIDQIDTLTSDDAPSYTVQAKPEWSQEKADKAAKEWSSDAQQLYIGWSFNGLSLFGTSRHAYYSKSKDRLLLVDYNWLGWKKHQTETSSPVYKLAAAVLATPSDDYLYDCKKCYRIAKDYGYQNTAKSCRAFMVSLPFFGPYWMFLDGSDKPQVLVNARTGGPTTDGWILDAIRMLFSVTL